MAILPLLIGITALICIAVVMYFLASN